MAEFVTVAQTSDLPESGKLCLEIGDRFVVVIRIESQYFCIDDVCSHDGGPLGEGDIDGYCISCTRHGAQFDVRSGEAITMPATEPTVVHEVRVVGADIQVRVNEN